MALLKILRKRRHKVILTFVVAIALAGSVWAAQTYYKQSDALDLKVVQKAQPVPVDASLGLPGTSMLDSVSSANIQKLAQVAKPYDSRSSTYVPVKVSDEDTPQETSYIVQFGSGAVQAASESLKTITLDEAPQTNAKAALRSQTASVNAVHKRGKDTIGKVAPKAQITKDYAGTLINAVRAKNLTPNEVENLRAAGYKVTPDTKAKVVLEQSVPLIGADQVWSTKDQQNLPVTGTNVRIGIIDSGVDYTHADLGSCTTQQFVDGQCPKYGGGYDFANNDNDPLDDNGHGTHVASTIAGNGSLKGVAPDAKLYIYKVTSSDGTAAVSNIIAALERAADPNQDGDTSDHLDVVNISMGGGGAPDSPLSIAADNAVAAGITVVVAAGNEGGASGENYGTVMSPGNAALAITVAASDKQGNMAGFSSRGPVGWVDAEGKKFYEAKPDIAAPGVSICAAKATLNKINALTCNGDSTHLRLNGTSMATPHVSGVAALMRQAHPGWTPGQIKQSMVNTAKDLNATYFAQGNGQVDALDAVSLLTPPVSLTLDPLPYVETNTDMPFGFASSEGNIQSWKLEYIKVDQYATRSDAWTAIVTETVSDTSQKSFSATLPMISLADGKYFFKLTVSYGSNASSVAYAYTELQKLKLASPLPADVYRSGSKISISDEMPASIRGQVSYSYGQGRNPSQWTPIAGSTWDTTGLSGGDYSIKTSVTHDGITESQSTYVIIDSQLKPGWPIKVAYDTNDPKNSFMEWYSAVENLKTIVQDIDKDGSLETVFEVGGRPPKLYAYASDGSLKWSRNLGNINMSRITQPPVASKDAAGNTIIYAYANNSGTFFGSDTKVNYSNVFAFDGAGQAITNWPVQVPRMYSVNMAVADMNHDGKEELILAGARSTKSDTPNTLYIFGQDGTSHTWTYPAYGGSYSYLDGNNTSVHMSIAKLEDAPDPNIVITQSAPDYDFADPTKQNGLVTVYRADGTVVEGWPQTTSGAIIGIPAIADINADGRNEIIFQNDCSQMYQLNCGRLYAYDRTGVALPGWPVIMAAGGTSSVAIGNLDGGNDLEVFTCNYPSNMAPSEAWPTCAAYKANGSMLPGWPQSSLATVSNTPIIGDIDGDNTQEIVITSSNLLGAFLTDNTYSNLIAWEANGTFVNGYPKHIGLGSDQGASLAKDPLTGKVVMTSSSSFDAYLKNGSSQYKYYGQVYNWNLDVPYNQKSMDWPVPYNNMQLTSSIQPSIKMSVLLTGRATDGVSYGNSKIEVRIADPSTGLTAASGTGASDRDGFMSFSDPSLGLIDRAKTYDVYVKPAGYLAKKVGTYSDALSATINVSGQFQYGDFNNSNRITVASLVVLRNYKSGIQNANTIFPPYVYGTRSVTVSDMVKLRLLIGTQGDAWPAVNQ